MYNQERSNKLFEMDMGAYKHYMESCVKQLQSMMTPVAVPAMTDGNCLHEPIYRVTPDLCRCKKCNTLYTNHAYTG